MRRKYLFLLPILLFGLTACNPKAQNPDNGNVNDDGGQNQDSNSNDGESVSIYSKDAYKSINIASPDFSTRKIKTKEKDPTDPSDAYAVVGNDATYEDLFNLGNKVTISINMEDSELQLLQQDYETGYKSEIYRHCKNVTISILNDGNTYTWNYDDVGIRQKGNTSRRDIFKNGEFQGLNHFKLSFDETFDDVEAYGANAYDWTNKDLEREERSKRDFLGLSGLDIKWNKNYDTTHIKEVYSAKLYQACGLLSQEIGLCEFNFNTSNHSYKFGLCTLYEPATKAMIKRHLKDDKLLNLPKWSKEKAGTYGVEGSNYGDLYKASYGVGAGNIGGGPNLSSNSISGSRVGVGNLSGSYIPAYERKTNTGVEGYTDPYLRNLVNKIETGSIDKIETAFDLKYFAATQACNYYLGNPDDLRNNNNNYMLYFSRENGKGYYIPIDNDRCFGIIKDWNPDGNGLKDQEVFATINATNKQVNNLFSSTILSSETNKYKAIYLNYVKAIKASDWVKNDTFNELYDIARVTYSASVTSSFNTIILITLLIAVQSALASVVEFS